jgi:hypothetical protein
LIVRCRTLAHHELVDESNTGEKEGKARSSGRPLVQCDTTAGTLGRRVQAESDKKADQWLDAILWSRCHEKASQLHMRKRLISPIPGDRTPLDRDGLDLANLGRVEITSEDEAYPIEGALQLGERRGWRAADAGPQIIRLLFDQPQHLKRIWLVFEETETQRTQEFVLRWSPDHGRSFREIVRQQWNFSPPATIRETEDYAVDLADVTVVELKILPDQSGGTARASLATLRLA